MLNLIARRARRLARGLGAAALLALAGCGATDSQGPAIQPSAAPTVAAAGACGDALGPITSPVLVGLDLDLWMMNADGTAPAKITSLQPQTIIRDAAWSPDGRTLAYSLILPARDPAVPWLQAGVICGFDRASGAGRLLASASINDSLSEPAWSPDSASLLVTRRRIILDAKNQFQREEAAIVRYELASGQSRVLIEGGITPAPAPDGKRLAYVRPNIETGFPDLLIANSDGSNPQPFVTASPPFKAFITPRWAPDGSQLMFTATGGPGSSGGTGDPVAEPGWLARWLAAGSAEAHGEPVSIWLIGGDGQGLRPLVTNIDDGRATWSPDSRSLIYINGFDGLVVSPPDNSTQAVISPPQPYWLIEWAGH